MRPLWCAAAREAKGVAAAELGCRPLPTRPLTCGPAGKSATAGGAGAGAVGARRGAPPRAGQLSCTGGYAAEPVCTFPTQGNSISPSLKVSWDVELYNPQFLTTSAAGLRSSVVVDKSGWSCIVEQERCGTRETPCMTIFSPLGGELVGTSCNAAAHN